MYNDEWIKSNFSGNYAETCREHNKTFGTSFERNCFKYHCKRLGLTASQRYYTDEEKAFLINNYPHYGRVTTAKMFSAVFGRDIKPKTIEKYCHKRLGLKCTEERKANRYDEFSVPVGTISINCRGVRKVKTKDGWVAVTHTIVDVPKGFVAIHLDKNLDNNSPENIAVVKKRNPYSYAKQWHVVGKSGDHKNSYYLV